MGAAVVSTRPAAVVSTRYAAVVSMRPAAACGGVGSLESFVVLPDLFERLLWLYRFAPSLVSTALCHVCTSYSAGGDNENIVFPSI